MNSKLRRTIIWSIPILWLTGSLLHFTYEWLNKSPIAGIFSAINESVWEHSKLLIWPLLAFWLIVSLVKRLPAGKAIAAAAASVWGSLLLMISLFYTYTGAFGVESLAIDIILFLICIVFGMWLGLYVFEHYDGDHALLNIVSVIAILAIITLTVIATFIPIQLPLFTPN